MAAHVPSKEDKEKFMSRAIELSKEGASKGLGGPFGSVVVKGGKIVGQYKNDSGNDDEPGGAISRQDQSKRYCSLDLPHLPHV